MLVIALVLVMLAVLDSRAGLSLQRRGTAAACVLGIVAAAICIGLCLCGIDRETDGLRERRRQWPTATAADAAAAYEQQAYFHLLAGGGGDDAATTRRGPRSTAAASEF